VDLVLHGNPPYPIHPPNKLGGLLGVPDKKRRSESQKLYILVHLLLSLVIDNMSGSMNELMYLAMLSGGNGNGNGNGVNDLLPILLMQRANGAAQNSEAVEGGGGATGGDINNEVLDLMVYRPLGQRMLENFAAKINGMTAEQRAKLQAALSLNMMSVEQPGKFGDTLRLAAHAGMTDIMGEPMVAISAASGGNNNGAKVNSGSVGAKTLGNATKSVKDQAKEVEVEGGETLSASGAKKAGSKSAANAYREVIVT